MKNYQNSNQFPLCEVPLWTTIKYFKKTENFYFLCISLFQLSTFRDFILPSYWSPTGPFSTMIPLLLCLLIEWMKDIYEWVSNFFMDRSVNFAVRSVWNPSYDRMMDVYNYSLKKGDLLFLKKDDIAPVDIVVIDYSSDFCKVNLSNLNGESYPVIINKLDMDKECKECKKYIVEIQKDNKNSIGEIEGIIYSSLTVSYPFSHQHVIVNGSILLNDCYGIVLNCGKEKKLFHSSSHSKKKINSLSTLINSFMMNTTIYILFGMVSILVLTSLQNLELPKIQIIKYFILKTIQSWIVLNGIIPFSLNILLAFFRFLQSVLLQSHIECVKKTNTSLIDQFKKIDYVLSDKTGTITKNQLKLIYVIDRDHNLHNIYDHAYDKKRMSNEVVRGLGLCTNIDTSTPEDKSIYLYLNSKLEYKTQCLFLTLNDEKDKEEYILYPVDLSFSVKRPISSQVFYDIKNDCYVIYTKASLSRLKNCLLEKDRVLLDQLDHSLTKIDGSLRLLGMAWRRLESQEILDYENYDILPEQFESHLHLIGVMGIQDNLVDDVSETIQKVCYHPNHRGFGLLTGDRKITTISIAKKIGLISDQTNVIDLSKHFEKYEKNTVIMFDNEHISKLSSLFSFINFKSKNYPCLLGYGLTPEGKKDVVAILNNHYHTLAIGDGMNDAGMLEEANIGISLSKNVHFYDFLCTDFKCLTHLFEYGTLFYHKNQNISLMTMIKSCSISFCLFWMLYENRFEWLFDLQTQQFFHLFWCISHPFFYVYSFDKKDKNHSYPSHSKLLWVLWILITFMNSTLLYHFSKTKECLIFNLIFQINLYLFFVDMRKQTFFIQFLNLCSFFLFYGFSYVFVSSFYYVTVIGIHILMYLMYK